MLRKGLMAIGAFCALLAARSDAYAGLWWPDFPPSSPETENDEFDGVSLAGKWSEWDPATFVTPALDTTSQMLTLTATGNNSNRWGGIYQPVPDTEFVVYAKLSLSSDAPGAVVGGLFVADDLGSNPTTADFRAAEVAWGVSSMAWQTRTWSAYNGTVSFTTARDETPPSAWVRLRVDGTSCSTDFSADGVAWSNFANVTLGSAPEHFGVGLDPYTSNVKATLFVDFVRVFSGAGTSDFDATDIGACCL